VNPQPDDDVGFDVATAAGPVRLSGVVIGVGDGDLVALMPSGLTRLVPLADLRLVHPFRPAPTPPPID
jgi:hypothetical protein